MFYSVFIQNSQTKVARRFFLLYLCAAFRQNEAKKASFQRCKDKKMWSTIIISAGIVLAAFALLSITILVKKNGHFPNTHVSQNKAMRDRGIHCVQTQDWQERTHKGLYDETHRTKHKK